MRPSGSILEIWAEGIRRGLLGLFLAQWALVWLRLWLPVPGLGAARWPEGLLVVLATATTLAALSRQLPAQNVMTISGLIAVLAGAAHSLGVILAVPFGPYVYTERIGPLLFYPLPWPMPMVWIVFLLTSRGVARLILQPWRRSRNYGIWVLGLTAALVSLLDLGMEPYATRLQRYWLWQETKTPLLWYGAPWVNFIGWGVTATLILAFITPWLISKRPVPPPLDRHSLLVWLLLMTLFCTAAVAHQLWPAALVTGLLAALVAGFAWFGSRRSERNTSPAAPAGRG